VVGAVALLLVVIAMQPSEFDVARTATISAPPSTVYPLITDFHKWEAWSPWAKLDPTMKTVYSGAPEGTGAIYEWAGNDAVGEGRMTIVDVRPVEFVGIKLDFIEPFASTNQTEFTLTPGAAGTTVTWSMRGEANFMTKALAIFMGGPNKMMDKMIGADFEKGLAQMKTVAESGGEE
jgi:uncharacterized protein YndB with AHSA1/START domain